MFNDLEDIYYTSKKIDLNMIYHECNYVLYMQCTPPCSILLIDSKLK